MNIVSTLWAPIVAGFFAGLFAVAAAGRWLRFVLGLRVEPNSSASHTPRRQIRIFGFPLLAFAHPIPWMFLFGLPYAAYYFVRIRQSPGGTAFFSTLGIMVLLWLVASLILIRSALRKRRQHAA